MTSQADSVRMDCAGATACDGVHPFSESVWERFWSKVNVRGPDECWEWVGTKLPTGYGQLRVDGQSLRAHRMIAAAKLGRRLLAGHEECACHHCDNPPCVNPKHIFVGSATDNMHDMLRKGRNGIGAKTRLGRIIAAVGRQEKRRAWEERDAGYVVDLHCDATIDDVIVACTVQVNDTELEDAPDTDELLDAVTASAALDTAIATLPFKMRAAMHLRRQGLTLEDIGQRLGVTREYIRQLEEKAIPKLQKHPAIAVLIRGKPFPAPVKRHAISNERARDINEKCAAFFERKANGTPIAKPRRGRPKGVKDSKPRRRPLTGCSFCQSRDHRIDDCLERWRYERRKEAA